MAHCAHYHPNPANGRDTPPPPPEPTACPPGEPVMNRYPHPVVTQRPLPTPDVADLHFLRCTLAYQNQLLADMKTLLQTLVQQGDDTDG